MRFYLQLLSVLVFYFWCGTTLVLANVTQIPGAIVDRVNDRADTSTSVTIPTGHGPFEIQLHFNKKHHLFVARVIEILKKDAPVLVNYFEHAPEVPLHILVNGAVYQSNGSATSFPKLVINLYDYPPAGSEHLVISGDWLRNLVVHELVHILHHSQIYGVNQIINYLFGAGRLMPMIVPRWFSEGIAVWAETVYTKSGRLRNPLYDWETKRTFLMRDFCDGAGCIDTPGKYPYRQFPYWAGAYFMRYLEQERAGSIKCLVRENAGNAPFFLNSAFESCLNRDAETSYRVFHVDFQDQVKEGIKSLKKSKKTLNYSFMNFGQNQISLQSGFKLLGEQMVFSQNINRDPSLLVFNLTQRDQQLIAHQDVINRIEVVDNQLQVGTLAFRGNTPLKFYQANLEQRSFERIASNESYIYVIQVKDKHYGLSYAHMRWRLFEILKKNKKKKDKQVFIFPETWQIYSPQILKGKLTFLGYDSKAEKYFLASWDRGKVSIEIAKIGDGEVLYDQFQCEQNLYLRSEKSLFRFDGQRLFQSQHADLKDIAYHRLSQQFEVSLFKNDPRGFYYRPSSCQKFNQRMNFKQVASTKASELKNTTQKQLNEALIKIDLPDVSSYYSIGNLSIDYWLLALSFDRDLFNTSFETAFTDPATNLSFSLRGIRYWDLQENGYDVGSAYRLSNNWSLGVNSSKFYSGTGFNNQSSYDETQSLGLGYFRFLGRYEYSATAFGAISDEQDFISSRKSHQYGIRQGIYKGAKKYNELVPRLSLSMSHIYQDTLNRSEFFGHSYALDFSLKYARAFQQHFYTTYSKQYKSDYGSGVLYAGRYNEIEVLGIRTNDLFGNEIMTARTQFDYLLDQFFQKDSIFPWYTREIRLIAGAEWFKGDFGFLNDRFFGRNDWYSGHAGVRLQTFVGYLLPLDVDILYTTTVDPGEKSFSETIITLRSSWWP